MIKVLILGKPSTGKKYISSILENVFRDTDISVNISTTFIKDYDVCLLCFNSYGDYVSEIKEWMPLLKNQKSLFLCYVMVKYRDLPFLKYFDTDVYSLPEQIKQLTTKIKSINNQ